MSDAKIYIGEGFVQCLDVMGSDHQIAEAARVCTGGDVADGERDRRLLRYLFRHRHTSPFEMAEMKFLIRCPIYVMRQWVRHRTASINEASLRYTESDCNFEILDEVSWYRQSEENRQGGGEYFTGDDGRLFRDAEAMVCYNARLTYLRLLEQGVSRELARRVLPVSLYTTFVWKIDLHNLLHFLSLRLDPTAQSAIREYARAVAGYVAEYFPETYAAFGDYQLNAVTLSAQEQGCLFELLRYHGRIDMPGIMKHWRNEYGVPVGEGHCRERDEFAAKLRKMNLLEEEPNGGEGSPEGEDRTEVQK